MSSDELAFDAAPAAPDLAPASPAAVIQAMRIAGAQQHDPLGFSRVELLAQRAGQTQGSLHTMLLRHLDEAIAECQTHHARRRAAADAAVGPLRERFPQAAQQLDALHARGDLRGLERLGARLAADAERQAALAPLRGLTQALAPAASAALAKTADRLSTGIAAPPELKVLRDSRTTWARLAVDRQLSRSLQKTPENAGPLNSHALVLRALQEMNAIAPGYLDRFVSQVETLFWLDQATFGSTSTAAAARPARRDEAAPPRPAPKRSTARRRSR